MRLDRYTLFMGIAGLVMTGCSTGRYASTPLSQTSHVAAPASDYNSDPAPAAQADEVLPSEKTSEVSHVKSVSLMSILTQSYKHPCVEESCAPPLICEPACAAPEQPCCTPQVECAEPGEKCASRWKKMFDGWHWPKKQSLCTPEPLCCAQKRQSCVAELPCVPDTTCAVPERCQSVDTQDCGDLDGCGDSGQHRNLMSSLCDRLFRKHRFGCSSPPSCVDDCAAECGDCCNATCSPLMPQCRNAPCHPCHGGSPLAPCLEDPFVRHENPATADRTTEAPADITAPTVPPPPNLNIDSSRTPGQPPLDQQPDRTLTPAPQDAGPQTYVEPQIWPRLKIAPVVRQTRRAGTYPAAWSR